MRRAGTGLSRRRPPAGALTRRRRRCWAGGGLGCSAATRVRRDAPRRTRVALRCALRHDPNTGRCAARSFARGHRSTVHRRASAPGRARPARHRPPAAPSSPRPTHNQHPPAAATSPSAPTTSSLPEKEHPDAPAPRRQPPLPRSARASPARDARPAGRRGSQGQPRHRRRRSARFWPASLLEAYREALLALPHTPNRAVNDLESLTSDGARATAVGLREQASRGDWRPRSQAAARFFAELGAIDPSGIVEIAGRTGQRQLGPGS